MSPNKQKEEREQWKVLSTLYKNARDKRGIHVLEDHQRDGYNTTTAEAKAKLASPTAPAMPLASMALIAKQGTAGTRVHQDHLADSGYVSEHWFALIHKQISIKDALRTPKAEDSLEAEWGKLWKQKFVDL